LYLFSRKVNICYDDSRIVVVVAAKGKDKGLDTCYHSLLSQMVAQKQKNTAVQNDKHTQIQKKQEALLS